MTTGTKTQGSSSGSYYDTKSWNGSDGKYLNGRLKRNAYTCGWNKFFRSKYSWAFNCNVQNEPGYTDNYPVVSSGVTLAWSNNDQLVLLGKLAEKIRGHSLDLGNFLATGNQALEQTLGSLKAIGCGFSNLRRGNIGQALRCLGVSAGQRGRKAIGGKLKAGDISGAWLAMSYGWLPTLSDVYEAWKLATADSDQPRSWNLKASHSIRNSGNVGAYPSVITAHRVMKRTISYRLTETLSMPRSLGLYDPLGIAWEVLPYSFVIDWFLPIGSYLDALSVFPYVSGDWCISAKDETKSSFQGCDRSNTIVCGPPGHLRTYNRYKDGTGSGNWTNGSFSRTVGTGGLAVPMPQPHFRDAISFGGKRFWNAVSLAHQKFRA